MTHRQCGRAMSVCSATTDSLMRLWSLFFLILCLQSVNGQALAASIEESQVVLQSTELIARGQFDEAITLLETVQVEGSSEQVELLRARAYRGAARSDEAIVHLKRFLDSVPEHREARWELEERS